MIASLGRHILDPLLLITLGLVVLAHAGAFR